VFGHPKLSDITCGIFPMGGNITMSGEDKRVLITGGAGFIGSHLVSRMLAQGHQVLCIDDFNDSYSVKIKRGNIATCAQNPLFALKEFDIRNSGALELAFAAFKPQIVVHLAARVGVRPSVQQMFLYESVNIQGTMNMLETSVKHHVEKFVFASSSSVYGINSKVPFAETDPLLKPISPYAATKIAGEALGHTFAHLHGLPVVALRFFTVYGPRQRPDLAIHKFMRYMYAQKPLPLYGDGSSSRDYTYIDDIIQGICAAINYAPQPYDVFNLGNSSTVTLGELIDLLERVTGQKAQVKWESSVPGDVPRTWADLTKSQRCLGYRPNTALDEGIQKFASWFKANA